MAFGLGRSAAVKKAWITRKRNSRPKVSASVASYGRSTHGWDRKIRIARINERRMAQRDRFGKSHGHGPLKGTGKPPVLSKGLRLKMRILAKNASALLDKVSAHVSKWESRGGRGGGRGRGGGSFGGGGASSRW